MVCGGAILSTLILFVWPAGLAFGDRIALEMSALIIAFTCAIADLVLVTRRTWRHEVSLSSEFHLLAARLMVWACFLISLMIKVDPTLQALTWFLAGLIVLVVGALSPFLTGALQAERLKSNFGYKVDDWVIVRDNAYKLNSMRRFQWELEGPSKEKLSLATRTIYQLFRRSNLSKPFSRVQQSFFVAYSEDAETAVEALNAKLAQIDYLHLCNNLGVVVAGDLEHALEVQLSALVVAIDVKRTESLFRDELRRVFDQFGVELSDQTPVTYH